ncbi:hypothetical protein T11_5829 [Trichinella zimbabwensis]|uniref:MULE transposase domain-containing protein n=1 Tax=Trichinella zimbabwensis TaxID=268475 RepID=A0A0V1HNK7_9BILA|nr:hypothetical protein T11_5829 [Trichinella zimbabwensis]
MWTNLDVTSVIKQNDHIESCPRGARKKRNPTRPFMMKKLPPRPPSCLHLAIFPFFKRLKSTMYNHRAKRFPKLPQHRRDLQIPVPFRRTKAGDEFLFWQSASRHILVFAMGSNIRLAAMRTWGTDGTFKVVPQWYQQLFTIHAFLAAKLLPAVYCLCTGKDIGTYGFIFQALLNKATVLGVNLNPKTIICDFETALIPAIQGYFPNTRVQGCYFHFCQAIHHKVGELGL